MFDFGWSTVTVVVLYIILTPFSLSFQRYLSCTCMFDFGWSTVTVVVVYIILTPFSLSFQRYLSSKALILFLCWSQSRTELSPANSSTSSVQKPHIYS